MRLSFCLSLHISVCVRVFLSVCIFASPRVRVRAASPGHARSCGPPAVVPPRAFCARAAPIQFHRPVLSVGRDEPFCNIRATLPHRTARSCYLTALLDAHGAQGPAARPRGPTVPPQSHRGRPAFFLLPAPFPEGKRNAASACSHLLAGSPQGIPD